MSGSLISQREEQPVLVLTCQRDSHPFQDRIIILNEIIKVGRSVARAKPTKNNAIFDCKVLSRSHALIWHKGDRFWLRDTNSSNGTFVNNTRIVKKNDEDFADREIFSGDIIRFGVDVVEHDTTHGCIIAQVALYHPNGAEAKQSSVDYVSNNDVLTGIETLHTEQMFRFTHYISVCFLAMVDEDRLLEKLSLYETQLSLLKQVSSLFTTMLFNVSFGFCIHTYMLRVCDIFYCFKDLPENSLQSHLMQALEEKFNLEKASKIMLERLLNEKAEVFSKATDLEHSLAVSQKECIRLRQDYENIQEAYQNLANDRESKQVASEGSKESNIEKSDVKVETDQLKDEKVPGKVFDQFLYSDHRTNNRQAHDNHNGDDANILMNGLDNGISKIAENHDDKLNNINGRFGMQNNFDLLKSSEPDNFCGIQGQHATTNNKSHSGHTSVRIIEGIRLFNQSNQLIKLLQDELSILAKIKRSNESTLSLPVNSDSATNKIDSFESIDTVDPDKNSLKRLDAVNCKENNFETALQRATEYATLVANLQRRVGADLNSLCLLPNAHDNADIFNIHHDLCIPPAEFRTTHVTKMDVSLGTETLTDHIQSTEVDETANQKVEINHLQASGMDKDSHTDEELSKLHNELMESANEIETYKQLTEDLRKQDAAKAELLLLVRGECDALKSRIAVIETDVATSRADHHRLISETRRAQAEANELLLERDNLSK
ncbi:SLAP, putative, partial [Schistosoma mansoni]|uniref:SLAP, putative n=1 Tax=Schistosoma mansoni TaxID=6183 RepID=UPI00022C8350